MPPASLRSSLARSAGTIQRANLIAVDNLEQAQIECGELIWAAERGIVSWRRIFELHQVVSG